MTDTARQLTLAVPAGETWWPERLVLHAPEVSLKGANRGDFERTLRANVEARLRAAGVDWPVRPARHRLYVEVPYEDRRLWEALAALGEVPGVATIAAASWVRPSEVRWRSGVAEMAPIEDAVVQLAEACWRPDATFVVRVQRVDKGFPGTSNELERALGAVVLARTRWERVRLKGADVTLNVTIYPDGVYVYPAKLPGAGGLPVGTTGRALALLSGGIDSPVAAWLITRRGCEVDLFHMSAAHADAAAIADSVVGRLAAHLSRYSLHARLFVAPYTHLDLALMGKRTAGYELMLLRRFIARCATRVAQEIGAPVLVTGDSLGQVASQTLENLVSASAATPLPLLRPLVGLDKQEIIALARRIGTYGTSIEPYKDCCALIARRPRTRTFDEALGRLEAELLPDYEGLVERTLADLVTVSFAAGRVADALTARPAAAPG